MNGRGRYQRHMNGSFTHGEFNFSTDDASDSNFLIFGIDRRIKKLRAFEDKPAFSGFMQLWSPAEIKGIKYDLN